MTAAGTEHCDYLAVCLDRSYGHYGVSRRCADAAFIPPLLREPTLMSVEILINISPPTR